MIALLLLLAAFVSAGAGLAPAGRWDPPRCYAARPDLQDPDKVFPKDCKAYFDRCQGQLDAARDDARRFEGRESLENWRDAKCPNSGVDPKDLPQACKDLLAVWNAEQAMVKGLPAQQQALDKELGECMKPAKKNYAIEQDKEQKAEKARELELQKENQARIDARDKAIELKRWCAEERGSYDADLSNLKANCEGSFLSHLIDPPACARYKANLETRRARMAAAGCANAP